MIKKSHGIIMQVPSKCLSASLNARFESVKRSGGNVFQNTEAIIEDDCLIFCSTVLTVFCIVGILSRLSFKECINENPIEQDNP